MSAPLEKRQKTFLDSITEGNRNWRMLGSRNAMSEFIAAHARFWRPAARPNTVRKMRDKQCFANSQEWLFKRLLSHADAHEWRYCEGYAASARLGDTFSVHHGWLVNRQGEVLDVTWRTPESCLYFGVAIKTEYVRMHMLDTMMWMSVFDSHYDHHALVRGVIPESEWKDTEAMAWHTPHDPNACDYNSQSFHDGFSAGKAGERADKARTCNPSYLEGWIMGDCEKGDTDA